MKVFLPIYCRPPNKLISYDLKRFDDNAGHAGAVRVATYIDKNGKRQQQDAQIIWDKK